MASGFFGNDSHATDTILQMTYQQQNFAQDSSGAPPLPCRGTPESITVLLSRINDGDRSAFDCLVPLVYDELHRIAEAYVRREAQHHTLQPTALIHEAYLRLADY